jgi:hypothetical protein
MDKEHFRKVQEDIIFRNSIKNPSFKIFMKLNNDKIYDSTLKELKEDIHKAIDSKARIDYLHMQKKVERELGPSKSMAISHDLITKFDKQRDSERSQSTIEAQEKYQAYLQHLIKEKLEKRIRRQMKNGKRKI